MWRDRVKGYCSSPAQRYKRPKLNYSISPGTGEQGTDYSRTTELAAGGKAKE